MIPTVVKTIIPTVTPTASPLGSTYTLGSNIVTNGTFDTDTAWTKNTWWAIDVADNNRAAFIFVQGSPVSLTQNLTTEDATEYRVEVEIVTAATVGIDVELGGVVVIDGAQSLGKHSGFITVSGTSNDLEIIALTGTTVAVDNVTVQKVTR